MRIKNSWNSPSQVCLCSFREQTKEFSYSFFYVKWQTDNNPNIFNIRKNSTVLGVARKVMFQIFIWLLLPKSLLGVRKLNFINAETRKLDVIFESPTCDEKARKAFYGQISVIVILMQKVFVFLLSEMCVTDVHRTST